MENKVLDTKLFSPNTLIKTNEKEELVENVKIEYDHTFSEDDFKPREGE